MFGLIRRLASVPPRLAKRLRPRRLAEQYQCAWCLRWKGSSGQPVGRRTSLRRCATHGICSECRERAFKKEARRAIRRARRLAA